MCINCTTSLLVWCKTITEFCCCCLVFISIYRHHNNSFIIQHEINVYYIKSKLFFAKWWFYLFFSFVYLFKAKYDTLTVQKINEFRTNKTSKIRGGGKKQENELNFSTWVVVLFHSVWLGVILFVFSLRGITFLSLQSDTFWEGR